MPPQKNLTSNTFSAEIIRLSFNNSWFKDMGEITEKRS